MYESIGRLVPSSSVQCSSSSYHLYHLYLISSYTIIFMLKVERRLSTLWGHVYQNAGCAQTAHYGRTPYARAFLFPVSCFLLFVNNLL